MTYIYIGKPDGKWARHDFTEEKEHEDEDIWSYIERVAPDLYDSLPDGTDFVVDGEKGYHPQEFETFIDVKDLVAWAKKDKTEKGVADRFSVAADCRRLKDSLPTDEWLTAYAVLNFIDLKSESVKKRPTSAKRMKNMVAGLMIYLLKDEALLKDFVASCGDVDVTIDDEGKVVVIKDSKGKEHRLL